MHSEGKASERYDDSSFVPRKTGKEASYHYRENGSGKTILLDALAQYLYDTCEENSLNEQNQIAWGKETDQIADTEKQITIRMN